MKFFVSCARGTEGPLRRELADMRIRAPKGAEGGVTFEGSFDDGMRACLWSRVGMRVLMEVGSFDAWNARHLYDGVRAIDMTPWLSGTHTLAVRAVVSDNEGLRHSGFAALKVKDALVDGVRDRLGARPDVNTESPDVGFFLHVEGKFARLYLDLSGEPLHRRGYRVAMTAAPLKENLGAAILTLSGADIALPVLDPMCGSGTFVIEQALRMRNRAPGLSRGFGFTRWPGFGEHRQIWQDMLAGARATEVREGFPRLWGFDSDPAAVAAARQNAKAAGVLGDIEFQNRDVSSVSPLSLGVGGSSGLLIANPPYGERLEADWPLFEGLSALGDRFSTWRQAVLAGGPRLLEAFDRRAEIMHRLFNGPLEVRLLVFAARSA